MSHGVKTKKKKEKRGDGDKIKRQIYQLTDYREDLN